MFIEPIVEVLIKSRANFCLISDPSRSRSHAIEMVFVFIATEHAGSSARSLMLS